MTNSNLDDSRLDNVVAELQVTLDRAGKLMGVLQERVPRAEGVVP